MRTRKEINEGIHAYGGRPLYESGMLEVLLDIRDLLQELSAKKEI